MRSGAVLIAWGLSAPLVTSACAGLIGIEDRPTGDTFVIVDEAGGGVEAGSIRPTPTTSSSTPVGEGGVPIVPPHGSEAGPAGTDCLAQNVDWSVGDAKCTASTGALANGQSGNLVDPTSTPPGGASSDPTGKLTVTCENGLLRTSNSKCETPQTLDLLSPTGCVKGYCAAAAAGLLEKCTADPAMAKAICVFRGYADVVTYATTTVPQDGASLCPTPDGNNCVGLNNTCNLVFSSVVCTY